MQMRLSATHQKVELAQPPRPKPLQMMHEPARRHDGDVHSAGALPLRRLVPAAGVLVAEAKTWRTLHETRTHRRVVVNSICLVSVQRLYRWKEAKQARCGVRDVAAVEQRCLFTR